MRDRERFSPAQCRAARGLLGWSVDDLAGRARLEPEAVELYEAEAGGLAEGELAMIGFAFVKLGEVIAVAEGLGGEGVRRCRPRTAFACSPLRRLDLADFEAGLGNLAAEAGPFSPNGMREPSGR